MTEVILDLAEGNDARRGTGAARRAGRRLDDAFGHRTSASARQPLSRPFTGRRTPRHQASARRGSSVGILQTVLDTAPQILDHVSSNRDLYPHSEALAALIPAYRDARAVTRGSSLEMTRGQPLTDAEIRVLAKLAENLTYSQAASELYVSINTVKTHLKHAYMKLGVTSRRSAISRAMTLELI